MGNIPVIFFTFGPVVQEMLFNEKVYGQADSQPTADKDQSQ